MDSGTKISIFNFDRPPILLIGSGVSRRYLKDSPDWNELLRLIAQRIGINEGQLVAFKSDAKSKCNKDIGEMPKLATDLHSHLNDKIKNGHIDPQTLFNDSEYQLFIEGVNPIKIMISTALKDLEIVDDVDLLEEIDIFKKLSDIIPCVVTTNYDCFLEDNIFDKKFDVYSRVSDYYYSDSQGIGEIFKIHGTLKDPSTIVIDEDDYLYFRDNSKIVSAKLLSTLCDYPMVIIGYQLGDANVKGILNDLISSLDEGKLREIEKNIIYISYAPGEYDFIKTTTNFDYRGKRLAISSLSTNNFKAIYQELSEMVPSESPSRIRKLRQLVKKIVLASGETGNRCWTLGINDISPDKYDKLVVAITDENYMRALKEIPIFTTDRMVESILFGGPKDDPKAVVKYFQESKRFRINEYVPIFHYLRESQLDASDYGQYLNDFIIEKKKQFAEKMCRYLPTVTPNDLRCEVVMSSEDVPGALSKVGEYVKPLLIMHYYRQDKISESEALSFLQELASKWKNMTHDSEKTSLSNLKCALTYLAFKSMGFED